MPSPDILFKALSDNTRLRALNLLLRGELCVCDLVAVLKLPQSTISRHLSILKGAGLVADRRRGTWVFYSVPISSLPPLASKLLRLLDSHLASLEPFKTDLSRLEKHLRHSPLEARCR